MNDTIQIGRAPSDKMLLDRLMTRANQSKVSYGKPPNEKVAYTDDAMLMLAAHAEIERMQNAIPIWMTARGYATGHGDTIEDMLAELEAQAMKRANRESSDAEI